MGFINHLITGGPHLVDSTFFFVFGDAESEQNWAPRPCRLTEGRIPWCLRLTCSARCLGPLSLGCSADGDEILWLWLTVRHGIDDPNRNRWFTELTNGDFLFVWKRHEFWFRDIPQKKIILSMVLHPGAHFFRQRMWMHWAKWNSFKKQIAKLPSFSWNLVKLGYPEKKIGWTNNEHDQSICGLPGSPEFLLDPDMGLSENRVYSPL